MKKFNMHTNLLWYILFCLTIAFPIIIELESMIKFFCEFKFDGAFKHFTKVLVNQL